MMFIDTMNHKNSNNDDFFIVYMIVYITGLGMINKARMPKTKSKEPLVH